MCLSICNHGPRTYGMERRTNEPAHELRCEPGEAVNHSTNQQDDPVVVVILVHVLY